jgi:hypothetical protein
MKKDLFGEFTVKKAFWESLPWKFEFLENLLWKYDIFGKFYGNIHGTIGTVGKLEKSHVYMDICLGMLGSQVKIDQTFNVTSVKVLEHIPVIVAEQ